MSLRVVMAKKGGSSGTGTAFGNIKQKLCEAPVLGMPTE